MSTSAAMIAALTSAASGFVIADVRPDAIAIGRNAALIRSRSGIPKLTFEAPHVEFTPSSSRSRRTRRNTCWPAVAIAPIGITSGSTITSSRGIPWSAARSTIRRADLEPDVGVLGDARVVVRDRDDRRAVLA